MRTSPIFYSGYACSEGSVPNWVEEVKRKRRGRRMRRMRKSRACLMDGKAINPQTSSCRAVVCMHLPQFL